MSGENIYNILSDLQLCKCDNGREDDDFERLKGQTKAESLFTKPPLINPSTKKRQDGRGPKDVRHICK